MKRIFSYTITAQDSDQRIYDFLCHHGYSRHIRTWLKQHPGSVRLNDKEALFYFPLKTGDLLEITLEEEQPSENIIPVCLPLHIIYEDEDLMVIDKPADMPVHPSIGNYTNTLANGVAAYLDAKGEHSPFRCINRLDRDTSGALILAKNAFSAAVLSTQMRNRQIRRTYLAVVEGITPPNGTISAPISRVDDSVIERHVDFLRGEPAVTHYERLETKNEHSLLEIHLETGRTHQIRVHMGYIGHPLPADYLYHPEYDCFKRQPLHSLQLKFRHPVTDKSMCLLAPVPEDMCNAF
jgi:23S rRNA pseudouridine1911/1915/1917 synthase